MSTNPSYLDHTVVNSLTELPKEHIPTAQARTESFVLAAASTLLSVIVAGFLIFKLHIVYGDALTRVLNAYYVIIHNRFHLAGIGFVWNPFPSLMELPFVLLHNVWIGILNNGLPANLISSIFSGVTVYYAHRMFVLFGAKRPFRILWSLLLALNPLLLLYGANGMSDLMMIGAFFGTTDGVLRYLKTEKMMALISAGVWLAAAFGIRYEAVPFGFFLTVGLTVVLWLRRKSLAEIFAADAILLFPVVCAALTWLALNAMIMHNPLYFMNSEYGNNAQTAQGSYTTGLTLYAHHNIVHSLIAVFSFGNLYIPVFIVIPLLLVLGVLNRNLTPGIMLAMCLVAVPLFQAYLLYKGNSAAWARFFIEFVAFGAIGSAYLIHIGKKAVWATLLTLVMVVGDVSTALALNNPVLGHGDYKIVQLVESGTPNPPNSTYEGQSVLMSERRQAEGVAQYINSHPNTKVLFDNFIAYLVVPLIKNPKQIVVTNDSDFKSILKNPVGRISAILVPRNQGVAKLDAVNVQYPNLWAQGAPWAHLAVKFPGPYQFRLYSIK